MLRKLATWIALPALLVSVLNLPAKAVTTTTSGGTTTKTYSYTGATETLAIPDNVTEVTIRVVGAQGGRGGSDYGVRPLEAGYRGVVSGTISVTPGQIITVAVGSRGEDSVSTGCSRGVAASSGDANVAVGGTNPLGGYAGGAGGSPGAVGCSGYGGAGGAATVIQIGTQANPAQSGTIVAGGSGASGGNGQYQALQGGLAQSSHVARTDTSSTSGQDGLYTYAACLAANNFSNCDGGGGAGGGGGAAGGARGTVEFGAGTNTEWYGLGSYPGSNSDGGYSSLTSSYEYYTYSGVSNKAHGSVVITYTTGVPSSPSGVGGVVTNGGVNLYWTAPTNSGVGPISGYTVEIATDPYSSWSSTNCSGTSTNCAISGLTNGTDYKFRVLATNTAGDSAYSSLSPVLTPSGPPSAPTIDSLTPGDGALSVAFSGATSDAPITDYEYSLDGGLNWVSANDTSSPLTISGLTNGTSYDVVLRAVNSIGRSDASTSSTASPSAVPGAPTITSVTATGPGELTVAFVAGYNGGSTISDFEYALSLGENTSSFGSYTSISSTSSPFIITGLADGSTYTVSLRAVNTAGNGPGSAYQTGVTLAKPNAPTISSISAADSRIVVSYSAYDSSSNGGSPISDLQYSTNGGSTWSSAGTLATSFTILGLTNGTSYSVSLRAVNAIGTSDPSIASSATPATVPSAPRLVSVAAGVASATVSWSAPSSTGGSAITGYQARAFTVSTSGSAVQTCSTSSTSCVISSLTNGTLYYFEVVATNAVGDSAAFSPRVSGTPAALPGAPTISSITAANQALSVAFSAGTFDSNAPITGYQYSLDNGTTWNNSSATTSPLPISSLTNGTSYTVKIRALSSIGAGAASNAVAKTPVAAPDAVNPGTISYTASGTSVIVSWDSPNDNGSSITSTIATAFSAEVGGTAVRACTASGTATTCTITSLTVGTTYYVSLQGQNAIGYSVRSNPRVAVRPGNASTITLVSSASSAITGDSVTLTATVTSGATGTVAFTSDGTSIAGCDAVAISSDQAVCTTSSLAAKTHNIRANYSGSASYASSTSDAVSVLVSSVYTTTFNLNGGSGSISPMTFVPGGTANTLPNATKTSYTLAGWYTSITGGSSVGAPGDSYTPTTSRTLYARWVQNSLYGMGSSTKIGTITTVSGVGNSYSATSGSSTVQVTYAADALPAGTVIDLYLLLNTDRAEALLPDATNFVLNLVAAWLASDGTVPNTADGKPLTMTITNPAIRAGAKIYSLLGNTATVLGVAQQDGSAVVEITEDPEIVVAITKPDAPDGVAAIASGTSATVSWNAPVSGGAAISSYTVTASTGQTCTTATTTCTLSGLANGVVKFKVNATNSVGTSDDSSWSTNLTIGGNSGGGSSGGSAGSSGANPVSNPKAPERLDNKPVAPEITEKKIVNPVLIEGKPVEIERKIVDEATAIEIADEKWNIKISVKDEAGKPREIEQTVIQVQSGDKAVFSGSGMAPNTIFNVYVFSEPILVGTITTDDQGNFSASLDLPPGLESGLHTLQMGTLTEAGELVTASIGLQLRSNKVKMRKITLTFEPDSSALTSAAGAKLERFYQQIKDRNILKLSAKGYVNLPVGKTSKSNLGLRRAKSVSIQLSKLGLLDNVIVTNGGAAGLKGNLARKVEITLFWVD